MLVAGSEKFLNGVFQLPHAVMRAPADLPLGEQTEPALNQVQPGGMGPREVQVIPRPARKPSANG